MGEQSGRGSGIDRGRPCRVQPVAAAREDLPWPPTEVARLVALSRRALPAMRRTGATEFAQTARPGAAGDLRPQGANLRYTAVVALGAATLDDGAQRDLLAGGLAAELAESAARSALVASDLGAVALAAWAAAEVRCEPPSRLLDRLCGALGGAAPRPTVEHAWGLVAAVAAGRADTAERAAARLLGAQATSGLFPHLLPAQVRGRHRAHVGCFADQVYPIQALARYASATGDRRALDAADRCAARIVREQGPAGQWWWHYDVRTGAVVEGYPVYSVHQHAMAPMALLELAGAGGADHRAAVARGVRWLSRHPEVQAELLDETTGAIWRKVGRREPRKAVRSARALATAVSPRLRLRALDRLFPPVRVDRECRPYELGWLLYAWGATPAAGRHGGIATGGSPAEVR